MSTAWCFMVYACVLLIGVQVPLSLQEATQSTETVTTSTIEVTTGDSTSVPDTSTTSDATISAQPTTEPSSTTILTTTTIPEISCYNGSCYGNVSDVNDVSCINTTISEKCMLSDGATCFQTVFKNSSSIVFEVGCKKNCEYLVEEGEGTNTMATTRCCDTDLCNEELLPDPDLGNAAVSVTSSISMTSCLVVLFLMI